MLHAKLLALFGNSSLPMHRCYQRVFAAARVALTVPSKL